MVRKAWSHVSYNWFFGSSILKHCKVTNWNIIFFSLKGILTNFRRCHLQSENLEKIIFVSKNWPNNPRDGCKPPSNLVELIKTNLNFEEELENFEGSFERNEIVDI